MGLSLKKIGSAGRNGVSPPAVFIAVCSLTFVAALITTVYFCYSMQQEMEMPGGCTMCMMWMQLPGQTLLVSALSFLIMWLAFMVAMMLPSALPMFLRTRRQWVSLCSMATGYFLMWVAAGLGVYVLGMAFMSMTMQSEWLSRAVPFLAGAALVVAGIMQLGRWKMKHLRCCRMPFGCAVASPQDEGSFRLGCRQGIECCICCAPPVIIQLVLGIMNPLGMIAVTIVIAAEKLLPRPEITTRLVGLAAVLAGFLYMSAPGLKAHQTEAMTLISIFTNMGSATTWIVSLAGYGAVK